MMSRPVQLNEATYDMTYMLECINKEQPEQAAFYIAYMLDHINEGTARANRNKPPMTLPICWTVLIMNQPEQTKNMHLRHDLAPAT